MNKILLFLILVCLNVFLIQQTKAKTNKRIKYIQPT